MGGASLFFARDPAPVEVLNDLDGDLVNLFRCLQDRSRYEELRHMLQHTLYSRAEFGRAIETIKGAETDPVRRAWAFFVARNQGMSGIALTVGNWGRTFDSRDGMAMTTKKWTTRLSMLDEFHERLMRVQIDNRDGIEVIRYWDSPDTVFYVDPPYHSETRVTLDAYAHEPDDEHHRALVSTIIECAGAVVLSGYAHESYRPLEECGWRRVDFETSCYAAGRTRNSGLQGDGAATEKVKRVESVWINRRADEMAERQGKRICDLFV